MSRKLTVIKQNRQRRRKLLYRRILTVSFVAGFFIISGMFMYSDRIRRLREAEAQFAQLQQQKEEILAQQEYYRSEISKLENEEFVAMLARQVYFKSLPHEILFRIGEIGGLEDLEDLEEN